MPEDQIILPRDVEIKLNPGNLRIEGTLWTEDEIDVLINTLTKLKPFVDRRKD